jgi:hypothetical protein
VRRDRLHRQAMDLQAPLRQVAGRRRHPRRARIGAAVVGVLRFGFGLGMAARPVTVPRALGVDTVSARRMAWLVQMCAVRDAALGAGGVHAAVTGRDVRPWLRAQAFSDAGDVVALGLAVRDRQVAAARAVVVGGLAVAAVLGGLMASREASREAGPPP